MPVNANWHRWIYASIADHIKVAAAAISPTPLAIVVEMLDKKDSTWEAAQTRAEATITGPITREQSPGSYSVVVDVTVVVSSHRAASGGTDYDHIDYVGDVANTLDQCIRCFDYGATGLLEIGKLTPTDPIEPVHLKPRAEDELIHSTVSARLTGLFEE